jgi:hypothetical protein
MTFKTYFENITPGMAAKLQTRYRVDNNQAHNLSKLLGNTFLSDLERISSGKFRHPLDSKK